jgi:hypothetical protein
MQAGAPNIACLLIGRIVAGVAIGILSMVVPLYNVSTSTGMAGLCMLTSSDVDGNSATGNSWLHRRSGTANDRIWVHHCKLGTLDIDI